MNVTIICDASYCHETRGAGYGYWIASERGKVPGGGPIKADVDGSSAAEMMAVVNGVAAALALKLAESGDKLMLQTDCQSAIQAFQNQRSALTSDERAAKDAFWKLVKDNGLTFFFKHVKGHTNRPEARYVTNRLCDQRARNGMQEARRLRRERGL